MTGKSTNRRQVYNEIKLLSAWVFLISVSCHINVELGSGILYKQKIVDLRQAFTKSSTWLPQV